MNLRERILEKAKPYTAPNGKTFSTLNLADRDELAALFRTTPREVEIAALEAEVAPGRYLRNLGSLGFQGQIRLLQAKALLVGAGGLGGTIAQLLARMGIGKLIVADGDSFSEDNLNRQALSEEKNIGVRKVQVARQSLAGINGATEVEIFDGFVKEKEFAGLLAGVQVAVDALDNMPTRFRMEKACQKAKVPLVHGAVAGFSGQITVIFPEDPGFRAIYGDPQTAPEKGIETELGNLAGIVSAVAALQVQETIKILTGIGRPLRNRLLFLDSLNGAAELISLK
jgi:molybdopterin/thiamine biosynthesis adenylyltransferase